MTCSTATNHAPAFAGHLHLRAAARDDGATFLASQSFRAPFHIGKPYRDGRVLQVRVVNPTAGILEGDRLEMKIAVDSGAALCLMTPATTRAFMMRSGAAACVQEFSVAAGGWLEFAPEPLCPHAGTNFTQATAIHASADAEVYFADALAPGRIGRGERHAWRHLEIALDVNLDGETVLREHLRGDGAAMARAAAFYGTPDAWLGSVVVLSPRLSAASPAWKHVCALHSQNCRVGASQLRCGGWIVRLIANSGQQLRETLALIRQQLAEELPCLSTNLRKL